MSSDSYDSEEVALRVLCDAVMLLLKVLGARESRVEGKDAPTTVELRTLYSQVKAVAQMLSADSN